MNLESSLKNRTATGSRTVHLNNNSLSFRNVAIVFLAKRWNGHISLSGFERDQEVEPNLEIILEADNLRLRKSKKAHSFLLRLALKLIYNVNPYQHKMCTKNF